MGDISGQSSYYSGGPCRPFSDVIFSPPEINTRHNILSKLQRDFVFVKRFHMRSNVTHHIYWKMYSCKNVLASREGLLALAAQRCVFTSVEVRPGSFVCVAQFKHKSIKKNNNTNLQRNKCRE